MATSKKAPKATDGKKTYRVLSTVKLNGTKYEVGSRIRLSEDLAEELKGFVKLLKKQAEAEDAGGEEVEERGEDLEEEE